MMIHIAHPNRCRPHLVEVEWRQVLPAHIRLLGVAALLQIFVSGQEETNPGARGGRGVLTGQEETNQHPCDLIVVQGTSVSRKQCWG